MASFSALYDADVLASIRLTDISIRLASTGLFRLLWSSTIHDEWSRAVARSHPHISPAQIARRREQMDRAMPQAKVMGYEHLVSSLTLPDIDDRHVLAAAIVGRADVIVTFNQRDFPDAVLVGYGLEAQHPDVFLNHQRTLDETRFLAVVKESRAALTNPPISADEYIDGLRRQGLQTVAAELDRAKRLI